MAADEPRPTAAEWLASFAEHVGQPPPGPDEVAALLELAAVAAHASERLAAPLACWMVGAAGLSPQTALAVARELDGPPPVARAGE